MDLQVLCLNVGTILSGDNEIMITKTEFAAKLDLAHNYQQVMECYLKMGTSRSSKKSIAELLLNLLMITLIDQDLLPAEAREELREFIHRWFR